jgi:hypothetical protein
LVASTVKGATRVGGGRLAAAAISSGDFIVTLGGSPVAQAALANKPALAVREAAAARTAEVRCDLMGASLFVRRLDLQLVGLVGLEQHVGHAP